MNRTTFDSFRGGDLDFRPQLKGDSPYVTGTQRHKPVIGTSVGASLNQDANLTAYAQAHYSPFKQIKQRDVNEEVLKSKSYARYRKNDPRMHGQSQGGKIEDGMPDLGELERHNRMKYGVKKPANVSRHEMDDQRIWGFQMRTTNFKTSMFDKDLAARIRQSNRRGE